MRITNEGPDDGPGQFGDLMRLQAEFQARLAEETFKYLRHLQGILEPQAPGTVVQPDRDGAALRAEARPGDTVALDLEIENRQRAYCLIRPALTPLAGVGAVTWYPDVEMIPPSAVVAPGERCQLAIRVTVPASIPESTYVGSLLLPGFREGALALTLDIGPPPSPSGDGA